MPNQQRVQPPDPFTLEAGWTGLIQALGQVTTPAAALHLVRQFACAIAGANAGEALVLYADGSVVSAPAQLNAAQWDLLHGPALEALNRQAGPDFTGAYALLPMSLDQTSLGLLAFHFAQPLHLSAQQRQDLTALGSLCALALGRTHLLTQQQATLQRQQHSERLLRRLIDSSPVSVAVGDLSGQLVLVNDAYLELLGYTRREFENGEIDWTALTPPEYQEVDEAAFARAFESGSSGLYEKEMLHRSGERLPLSVTLLRYREGDTQYVVGYLSDVREKRAAELLARTQAYEGFAELTRDLSLELDPLMLVGRAQELIVSLLPSSVSTYYELRDEAWQLASHRGVFRNPALLARLQLGLPRGQTVNIDAAFDLRLPYYQDKHDPSSVAAAREEITVIQTSVAFPVFSGPEVCGVLVVGLHLRRPWSSTERVLLESVMHSLGLALERSGAARLLQAKNDELAARTSALEGFAELTRNIDFQSDPYALIKRTQEIVYSLLPSGFAVYYEPEGDLWRLKSQVGSVGNPELQAVLDAGISYAGTPNLLIPWQSRTPYYQERYDRRADHLPQVTEQLQTTATLPVLVAGEPRGIFAFGINKGHQWTPLDRAVLETVVRALQLALEGAEGVSALRQRSAELERSNRELEQFAFIASHDLQEPLRTVTNYAQMLVRRANLASDPKALQYAGFVTDGTARMRQLILDLLNFSRITQGQQLERLDLQQTIKGVLHDLQATLQDTGANIEVDHLPSVLADETQMRQLFQNLIGNALKFRAAGRSPLVQVKAQPAGASVRFEVRDNGIGIAPEHSERIFTLFQRLHHRSEYEGSGVGLAIARRIVEHHGGRIWLESRSGEGTSFFFTLPV